MAVDAGFRPFAMTMFFIGHVYMVTTGRTIFEQIKAMISGYDHVDEEV